MADTYSEWTEEELKLQPRCFCECHTHPGTYPTTEERPCRVCRHVNAQGYFPGFPREGWVRYWSLAKDANPKSG